jgi:DNA polymerase III subunit delta'
VNSIPDQPLAEKILTGALAGTHTPQQFLFYGPPGTGKRAAARQVARALIGAPDDAGDRALMDLTVIRASGAVLLVDDLEQPLRDLASRPVVGQRRVAIVEDAARLSDVTGNRILKPLEEPPAGSFVILVADRAEDVLATVRSRCVPVPFRSPGREIIAARLEAQGVPAGEAAVRARTEGTMALAADPYWRAMRAVGVALGIGILKGATAGAASVGDAQRRMEAAASEHPSEELVELRRAAVELEGKRGGRTAAKKAEDQEKRERRRMVSDGWETVLGAAASVVADGLAVAVGAPDVVRNRDRLAEITAAGAPAAICIRALEELEMTRADLALNPTVDLAVEAMLIRIDQAHRGEVHPLRPAGRLAW